MTKTISIICRQTTNTISFALQLAKAYGEVGQTACLVNDHIVQDLLNQYDFDLIEMSGVDLYANGQAVGEASIICHMGYLPEADYYLILLEQDIFYVKSLARDLQGDNFTPNAVVLLGALDTQQGIDYLLEMQLKLAKDDDTQLIEVAIDERDLEVQFDSQLNGQIITAGLSRARRKAIERIIISTCQPDKVQLKQLAKSYAKRGMLWLYRFGQPTMASRVLQPIW